MSMIDGRAMATEMRTALKAEVEARRRAGVVPTLAVVMLGDDPAARAYVRGIERASTAVDLACQIHRLPEETSPAELCALLDALSANPQVHGIIVQTPLPAGLKPAEIGAHIAIEKDVDGFNPTSVGHLTLGLPSYAPATAAAVCEILHRAQIPLRGAQVVVIGRSSIVGKPVSLLLLRDDATVTICHSRTHNLADIARQADVLIVAIGRARFVSAEFVKPGATVIDVGINEGESGLVGDVDFEAVAPIAGAITPVPGGVGPLTNVILLQHTVQASYRSKA